MWSNMRRLSIYRIMFRSFEIKIVWSSIAFCGIIFEAGFRSYDRVKCSAFLVGIPCVNCSDICLYIWQGFTLSYYDVQLNGGYVRTNGFGAFTLPYLQTTI